MKPVLDWLDHRTRWRSVVDLLLFYPIPGGAKWRYVWGSLIGYGLLVQFITGTFLWMAYSPSTETAWESVYYIQYQMLGGWLLRGIHHYMAGAMVVLLAIHLVQVVIWGAYRAPREFAFWSGLLLIPLILVMSQTGYLLPWDQRGYRATTVATNIAGMAPGLGPYIKQVAVGGTEFNHHTLTRFFALHAGVLPAILVIVLLAHFALVRLHGPPATEAELATKKVGWFWPDQLARDAVACTILILIVVGITLYTGGAELGPPADPDKIDRSSRPEWYFLFLFHMLRKYTTGEYEILGAHGVPAMVGLLLFLMPFIGRTEWGRRFNIGAVFALLGAVAFLSIDALIDDSKNADYLASLKRTQEEAEIYAHLAGKGIPAGGPKEMAMDDASLQGPYLFAQYCASCHRINGHDGLGLSVKDPATAFDLAGFASRAYVADLLDPAKVKSPHFFGSWKARKIDPATKKEVAEIEQGNMLKYVLDDVSKYDADKKHKLAKAVKALSAEAQLPRQAAIEAAEAPEILEGRDFLAGADLSCIDCHKYREAGEPGSAPDLTGYGSQEWLEAIIRQPGHNRFYGYRYPTPETPRAPEDGAITLMPSYGEGDAKLSDREIRLLAEWLRTTQAETKAPLLP